MFLNWYMYQNRFEQNRVMQMQKVNMIHNHNSKGSA